MRAQRALHLPAAGLTDPVKIQDVSLDILVDEPECIARQGPIAPRAPEPLSPPGTEMPDVMHGNVNLGFAEIQGHDASQARFYPNTFG
jgi:hypothetical protein